jgi:hypothetical protein
MFASLFGVKHFQTIHHRSVDVARGLVLLKQTSICVADQLGEAVMRPKTDLNQLLTSAVSSNNTKEVPTGTATRRQERKSQSRSVSLK